MAMLVRGTAAAILLFVSTAALLSAAPKPATVQLRIAFALVYCGGGATSCSSGSGEYHAAGYLGLGPTGGARTGRPVSVTIGCDHGFGSGHGRIYLVGGVQVIGAAIKGSGSVTGTAADDRSDQTVRLDVSATQSVGGFTTHATAVSMPNTAIENGPANQETTERIVRGGVKISISGTVEEAYDYFAGAFHGFKRVQAAYTCVAGTQAHVPGAGDSVNYDFDAEIDRSGPKGTSP